MKSTRQLTIDISNAFRGMSAISGQIFTQAKSINDRLSSHIATSMETWASEIVLSRESIRRQAEMELMLYEISELEPDKYKRIQALWLANGRSYQFLVDIKELIYLSRHLRKEEPLDI